MANIPQLTSLILSFRDARDWKQFHNMKDMAISLNLEASEVLEHFQWKTQSEVDRHLDQNKPQLSSELADVLYWLLLMAHDGKIDLAEALQKKITENEIRYPVDKAKGNHTKYTDL